MSSPYFNVTTHAGDAAIANAIATTTKLNITHVAFGDGNGSSPTPDKTRTTLVKEVYRQGVNKYEKHPTINNFVVVEAILPPIVGSFYIREIGLIIDGMTLISHGAVAPVYKEANSVREYRLKFTINIQDAEIVNVVLDDTLIYATQNWVDENYLSKATELPFIAVNQTWKTLTSQRFEGVFYLNPSKRPIQVVIAVDYAWGVGITFRKQGINDYFLDALIPDKGSFYFVVPPETSYMVKSSDGMLINYWGEMS